jgi:hypothetical protein
MRGNITPEWGTIAVTYRYCRDAVRTGIVENPSSVHPSTGSERRASDRDGWVGRAGRRRGGGCDSDRLSADPMVELVVVQRAAVDLPHGQGLDSDRL